MVVKINYVPERGDVVWLVFDPQAGHEQAGRRPALVLSPASYNGKTGLALFCPITSQVKMYPFEIPISVGTVSGVVLADQIKNLDWRARQADFICKAPNEVMVKVFKLVGLLLKV